MNEYFILCVDDELEVLDSVSEDLREFENYFDIETAESAESAKLVIDDMEAKGKKLALIFCDHVMPKKTGVDFLVELFRESHHANCKKVLLTGQAGLNDAIHAINSANINYFMKKPWTNELITIVARKLLTEYIIENCETPLKYTTILDATEIYKSIHQKGSYEEY